MALTQKTGALANAGAQAQSVASTLANLAANLHYTGGGGQPRKSYGQEPVYYAPAPVNTYRPPQQTGSFSSGSGAAAAQHLLTQARNQQVTRQNVFNDVAKQAVMTALAVATGQQPGRQYTTPPTLLYRQGGDAAGHQLTPQQESQLFDQQIQATKLAASQQAMPGVFTPDSGTQQRINGFNANIDTMRSGFTNARPNPRLTQEGQVLSAFPQMTPQQLRTRSGSQLQALLDLAKQPPASAAGSSDQVGGQETSPNPMTHNQPPKGPPPQPAYSPLPTWDTTRGAPAQPPYNPLPTGAAQVSQAMEGAMKPFGTEPGAFEQTSGDTTGGDSGGGGFWDTVGDIVTTGLSLVPGVSSLMQIVQGGKAAWDALSPTQVGDLVREMTEAGAGTYEQFLASGPGQVFATIMNGLDAGRQWNTGNVGALAYRTATKSPFFGPGDWDSDHYISLFPPLALAFEAAYRADPTLEARVVDWHDNGYSSPSYIKTAEAAGIDWHEQPQFTGDQAVYEGLMGLTDQMPAVLKYPFRMATDILLDPLSMLTVAAKGGAVARELGIGLRTAEDATLGGRVIGGILEGTGAAVEGGARLPDLPVEGLVKGAQGVGGKLGEVTGLLSPSTAGRRIEASADIARLSDDIAGARESVPDVEMRTAFDAEAQGVAPTSGPELIGTPVARTETPTVVAREGGEPTVIRSTGTATVDRGADTTASVTGATGMRYPTFESLRDAPNSTAANPVKVYSYNGQDLLIRTGTARDGVPFYSASPVKATKVNQMVTRDSYTDLMDALPREFGGQHPPFNPGSAKAAPTANETALADVNKQIKAAQADLRSSNPDKMMVAAEKLKLLHAEWERLRGEIAAEKAAPKAKPTPPATKAEREAAAAAGSTPDTPRSPGASETVRAAENAKATTGKGKMKRLSASERKTYGALAKSQDRYSRLAKEDAEGLPKEVNKILAAQKPGEHEFSPIYNGHRPLDQIVTKAIDSKDPALMKKADAFVKKVDQAVEQHLRPDPFYRTWKNGGAPVFTYSPSGAFADDFFEAFRVLEPDADPGRLRVLANGLAKGTLDDIAELQFQLKHLIPMLTENYADEFTLDGIFGAVGRIESKDYKAESARWLIREYLDTPKQAEADKILHTFLTGETEAPLIADGIHKPYAHSIVDEYQAESIARLQEMRTQWRTIKRAEQVKNFAAVREQSDAAFREADIPAQLEGGKKSISKQMAAAMRATKHGVKATDEAVNVAIGEIKDAEIAHWLLNGDGKLTIEQAKLADRAMPSSWRPTGYTGGKTGWNVKEALDWIQNEHARHPSFDYAKARDDIGQLAHGLQPKMTPAQVKAARKAAEAQGIDPKTIKDGTSMGERLAATRGIRALDWAIRQLRSVRLYNIITGLGNRIGDIAGNSVAHLIGRDVRSALLQTPKTFTETRAWRRLMRDPAALNAEWVKETPHMAELGITYPDNVLGAHKLSEADPGAMLPPLQGKLDKWNAPRGVKWLSNAWTAPYLKDMTMAGEMVGRKLSFDRVVLDTIKNEAWPAFKEYLEGRFPGQSDQLLKDIYTSAREKGGKSWSGHFSAGDVQKVVDEDAARKWQREVNRAVEKGGDEADHLFFKGKMTNADEIARRTLTFHFWMVRASALYGRTLLRNPGLLSGFYRLHEEAQQIAEEQGLPGWLGTMYKFMSIPGAGSGYGAADPINILFPLFFLDAYSQEGNKFQAFQNLLIPEWSAALGALGLTQNIPDLTGTRSPERFVVDMGNFLKGEGVDLEAIPFFGQYINTDSLTFKIPTEEFTKLLIEKANGLVGTFGDFKPFDRAANEHDQLYSIGEQIGQGLWGEDMTQWSAAQIDELTAAVAQAQNGDGEETWLSETIRAAYGREGAARAIGALVIPGGVVTRQGFRDSQIEQSHDYWQDFYDGKPTTKAGESAAVGRQLATSAQPAWIAMNTDYYQIGTKQEQSMYSSVNDMLFSPGDLNPHQSIIIDNGNGMFTVYNMSQLAALSDDERQQVVYAWLDQNKGVSDAYTKVKDGRAAFKADHPDYAQYSEYQKGVFGYQGGPTQFRRDMQDNPTFKAAEDEQRKQLKKEGKTGAVLEAELDHWATTQAAFFAATGQKYKTDDTIKGTPGPSSVAAMFSLRPDKESSGSGGTKKAAPKDPTVNDYWSPAKGIPRLQEDQAQFEHDNAAMEATFGPYWNEATADWEDNADSAKERDKLGIGDIPYVMPSVSETMRRYEEWEYRNPGGSPEEFFAEMLQTPGFGKKVGTTSAPALPGGTVISKPAGVAAYPSTPTGKLQAAAQQLRAPGVAQEPQQMPTTATTPRGKSTITGGKTFALSQDYGMTTFAASQSYPGGLYGYTDQYTKDGSYVGHMGIDIGVPLGTPLFAPVSGKVVQSGGVPFEYDDRYRDEDGNALPNTGGLRIELPNGDIVVMAHMQQITVNVGDTVTVGQPVGYSGESGADPNDPGSGAHVHVEYRQYAPGQTGSGYLAIDPRTKLDLGV